MPSSKVSDRRRALSSLKQPIYDEPSAPVTLAPVPPSALALEIGKLRRWTSNQLGFAEHSSRQAVDGVLGVERSIESRLRALHAAEEPLTPNVY